MTEPRNSSDTTNFSSEGAPSAANAEKTLPLEGDRGEKGADGGGATPAMGPAPADDEADAGADARNDGESDAGTDAAEAGATLERPFVDATAPRPAVMDTPARHGRAAGASPADPAGSPRPRTRFRDVTGALGSYLRGRVALIAAFGRGHRIAAALLLLLTAGLVTCLAVALGNASDVPGTDLIEADAKTRLAAPDYQPGDFGADDILVARSASVGKVSRSATAIDSSNAQFGASGYATAEVTVEYSGGSVKARQTATLGYARVDGQWVAIGEPQNAKVAWEPTAGVDQKKVVAGASALLERADASFDASKASEGAREMTLAQIYEGAQISVASEAFDAQTRSDAVTLTCVKQSDYESYSCTLDVTFSFSLADGSWSVSEATASAEAKTRTFDPLMGNWTGTFQSQSTQGAKCLAAGTAGLSITLSKNETTTSGSQLTGTISGLAHYHEHPSSDAESCDGDKTFEDVPFMATLVGGHDDATGSDLAFVATLPEEVGGTVTVTLGFGTSDDPSRVVAVVKTTYPHTGSFLFIPYNETIVYEDLFVLKKAGVD